ncbi:MAG: exosortase K [Bacteroidota bacterium]
MLSKDKTIYFFVAAVVFIGLKFWYTVLTTDDLFTFLLPMVTFLEVLTHSTAPFLEGEGFYLEAADVLINKSCSGFNLWLMCFLMLSFLGVSHSKNKLIVLPISLLVAYLFTVLVNSSRIFVSILVQEFITNQLGIDEKIVHEAIGITTNLGFLILLYFTAEKLLSHEKPPQS